MNYGSPLLPSILYISKPNVDCMELGFHSHTISYLTQNQALISQILSIHQRGNSTFWTFVKSVTVLNIIVSNFYIHCTKNFNNFLF